MKFTEIKIGYYQTTRNSTEQRLDHSVYALGDDGKVYKYYRSRDAWEEVGLKIKKREFSERSEMNCKSCNKIFIPAQDNNTGCCSRKCLNKVEG